MDNLLVISNVVLWCAVAVLAVLVYALTRQVGALFERVAPAGALMVNQVLNVGDAAPVVSVEDLAGIRHTLGGVPEQEKSTLLFFLAPDCPICKSLLPVLRSVTKSEAWVDIVLASDGGELDEHKAYVAKYDLTQFPYVLSELLGKSYGVAKLPYAVLIDEQGLIASLGLINSREHLESLFEAKELNVTSIQDYMQKFAQDDHYDASSGD